MAEPQLSVRVVKIGGSLLELGDLNLRLEDWSGRQVPATTIWIVGGGEPVEEIRRSQDQAYQHQANQNSEAIHWKCIEKMDVNAKRIASNFPDWKLLRDFENLDSVRLSRNWILLHTNWTRQHASHLPKSWDVTSDSIAATFANWVGASDLVLLKSADPPLGTDIQAAASLGFIDPYFLQALNDRHSAGRTEDRLSVRVVNLRSETYQESVWVA